MKVPARTTVASQFATFQKAQTTITFYENFWLSKITKITRLRGKYSTTILQLVTTASVCSVIYY